MDNDLTQRNDKIKALGLDESMTQQISDDILDKLYEKFMTKKSDITRSINAISQNYLEIDFKNKINIKINKYIITLDISNECLVIRLDEKNILEYKSNTDHVVESKLIDKKNANNKNNITSPDIESFDIESLDVASLDVVSRDIASPDIASLDIASPDIASTDVALYNAISKDTNIFYPKLDKNNEKYVVFLEFLNELLIALNKEKIDDILKFKNIDRDDLLKPECDIILQNNLIKLTRLFEKSKLRYWQRKKIKNYIITIIKTIAKMCGYSFKSRQKQLLNKIDKNNFQTRYISSYNIC